MFLWFQLHKGLCSSIKEFISENLLSMLQALVKKQGNTV